MWSVWHGEIVFLQNIRHAKNQRGFWEHILFTIQKKKGDSSSSFLFPHTFQLLPLHFFIGYFQILACLWLQAKLTVVIILMLFQVKCTVRFSSHCRLLCICSGQRVISEKGEVICFNKWISYHACMQTFFYFRFKNVFSFRDWF